MAFKHQPSVTPLTEYLCVIKELHSYWGLDDEKPYGEVETLWFRGHRDSRWKLTPKLYRQEFSVSAGDALQHFHDVFYHPASE